MLDYATEETKNSGFKMIEKEINSLDDEKLKTLAQDKVNQVKAGDRDVYV